MLLRLQLFLEWPCDPNAGGVNTLGDRLAERVALLGLGLGGLVTLDNARAVKALAERNGDGVLHLNSLAGSHRSVNHSPRRNFAFAFDLLHRGFSVHLVVSLLLLSLTSIHVVH